MEMKTETPPNDHTDYKAEKESKKNERPTWSNGLEFLMSCISLSVGLGNIWRFPFTAYENGGGAFLIPYIVVLFLIGKPMYYLEMTIGQFTSKGSVKIWSLCPAFLGVGYGQAFATICIISYYSSLLALTLYYMGVSFQSILPWTFCRDEWGSGCVDSLPKSLDTKSSNLSTNLQSSSELYFLKNVIKEKEDISDGLGAPVWEITLTLFVAWIVIFLVIMRGVKSSGKAAYFLAMFPYVVLIALLIRAVTLEGAVDGIIFFLKPNWIDLLSPKVWKEAVVQCFFSLSVGLGPVIMFSSYNQFKHNVYRDAMIVTSLDAFTSLLAGITIFGILGNLAHNLGIARIQDVIRSGTGLAFISYPDAIAKFNAVPQVFAVLFFLMLFVLGVGSIVALQSTIVTIVCDQFKSLKYWKVALISSICGFFLGLVYVTPGGQWILNLVDFYGGTYVVFALAIFEIIGISWIYGVKHVCDDIYFMTNRTVTLYWRLCWYFFTPLLMIIIFVYSMISVEPITYSGKLYPEAANVAGWIVFAIGFIQFPLWGIWYISNHHSKDASQWLKASFSPSKKWGPDDSQIHAEWALYKANLRQQRLEKVGNGKLNLFKHKCYNLFNKT